VSLSRGGPARFDPEFRLMPVREIIAVLLSSFALLACSTDSKVDAGEAPAPTDHEDPEGDLPTSGKPEGSAPADSGKPSTARDAGRPSRIDAGGASPVADTGAPALADATAAAADAGDTSTEPPAAAGPKFPAVTDAWAAGPFEVATGGGAGPSRNANLAYPKDLGKDGLKHPIVIFDNGAGQTGTSIYTSITQHLASHGFAVYHAYESTDDGKEITEGLDWMIAENTRQGGMFFGKLDTTKAAAMGHSRGSIATFAVAGDPRLSTTIHLSGGTNPDIAMGHATLVNLKNPAAFLCGEPGGDGLISGDTASEWCLYDFEHTTLPVFLTQITGASHISAPGMTTGACAGWLRWRLMGDSTMKAMFAGSDCSLCKRPNWVVKQRDLDMLP
jgi:hypothetical protein